MSLKHVEKEIMFIEFYIDMKPKEAKYIRTDWMQIFRPVASHVQGVWCTRALACQGLLIPENNQEFDDFASI